MQSIPGDSSESRIWGASVIWRVDPAKNAIPWASAGAWREAQQCLARTIVASHKDLGASEVLAEKIIHRYDLAGDHFDALADTTCKVCRRPCCQDAKVWLDFKDLLLIHLGGQAPPDRQLRRDWRSPCRYLTSCGCVLPRAVRPWICTWYVCPDQRRALQRDIPGGQVNLDRWWPEIAALRKRMEAAFVNAVST